MTMTWITSSFLGIELLGLIPSFIQEDDPRPVREQIDERYAHGGGWCPFEGFYFNPRDSSIQYPGDPPYAPIATARLRNERIFVYPSAWVLILQVDGSYEISRID